MKAVVAAFNQEKALVGAFFVFVQLHRFCCQLYPECLPVGSSAEASGYTWGRPGIRIRWRWSRRWAWRPRTPSRRRWSTAARSSSRTQSCTPDHSNQHYPFSLLKVPFTLSQMSLHLWSERSLKLHNNEDLCSQAFQLKVFQY